MRRAVWQYAILSVSGLLVVSFAYAQSEPIPSWIKVVAGAWANGTVSDAEFVNAIEFLSESDVIQIDDSDEENTEQPDDSDKENTEQPSDAPRDETAHIDYHEITRVPHARAAAYAYNTSIEDIAIPLEPDKCFDRFGDIKTPTIDLKFAMASWSRAVVEVTGSGITIDTDKKDRPLIYQFANSTHYVSWVQKVPVFKSGLQIDDITGWNDVTVGKTYELISAYGDQCGRTKMVLGY